MSTSTWASLLRSTSNVSRYCSRFSARVAALKKPIRSDSSRPSMFSRGSQSWRPSPMIITFFLAILAKYSASHLPVLGFARLCRQGSAKDCRTPVSLSKTIALARTRTLDIGIPARARTSWITSTMPAETISTGIPRLRSRAKSSWQPSRHLMPEAVTISGSHSRRRPCSCIRPWLLRHHSSQFQLPAASSTFWSAQSCA
mmetsp:Transcript_40330/g.87924  ORF Transcript_40330/g.87924 Transcript_40330/m.87924 type:complete len:200 (+) Transcript_40330:238-837(+)